MRTNYESLYEKMSDEVSGLLYDKVQEIFIEMQNRYIPDLTDGNGGYEVEENDKENELAEAIMTCLDFQYYNTYDKRLEEVVANELNEPEFEDEDWGF